MSHIPNQKTRDEVAKMAACGVPVERISKVLKITEKEVKLHYSWELENGASEATKDVADALYRAAMGGDVKAMMFWLKARGGWKDIQTTEIIGSDEHPGIQVQIVKPKSDKKGKSDDGSSNNQEAS